jgi:hypothetical protein
MVRLPGVSDPEPFGVPLPFTSPLSIADLDDLRFYLEDYASLPVGEYAVRGERVERKLSTWGEALFASIFSSEDKRKEAYFLTRMAKEPVEVSIRSNNPSFLTVPWELMKAPAEREPISLRVSTFDRSLLVTDPVRQFASTAEGFHYHPLPLWSSTARPPECHEGPGVGVPLAIRASRTETGSSLSLNIRRYPRCRQGGVNRKDRLLVLLGSNLRPQRDDLRHSCERMFWCDRAKAAPILGVRGNPPRLPAIGRGRLPSRQAVTATAILGFIWNSSASHTESSFPAIFREMRGRE